MSGGGAAGAADELAHLAVRAAGLTAGANIALGAVALDYREFAAAAVPGATHSRTQAISVADD